MTFTPASLGGYYRQGEGGGPVVNARVNPVPNATVYVRVLDPGHLLVPGPVSVTDNGNGNFSAFLPVNTNQPIGAYSGALTVELCKDPACASAYSLSGNSLPYSIHLTGHPTATATAVVRVNGADSGTGGTIDPNGDRSYAVTMTSGQTLEIDSTVDIVRWSWSSPYVAPLPLLNPHTFRATLTLPPGFTSSALTISEMAADGQGINVHVTLNP
jgi:hypothetical protein